MITPSTTPTKRWLISSGIVGFLILGYGALGYRVALPTNEYGLGSAVGVSMGMLLVMRVAIGHSETRLTLFVTLVFFSVAYFIAPYLVF